MTESNQSQAVMTPHVRLSLRLAGLLEEKQGAAGMSLNQILQRTEGRGIYLVMIFACLPFVVPVSLPGLSTILGLIVGLLSLRLARGKPPALPRFLGEHVLKPKTVQRILRASVRFLRFLEKLVRPRRTRWLAWPSAMFVNGGLMAFMALVLALPFPPIVLFTNSLPSYAIILIAVSVMEEDGVTIWLGYAAVAATLIYFGLMGGVLLPHLVTWTRELVRTLGAGS
jgi:hypothetical protein